MIWKLSSLIQNIPFLCWNEAKWHILMEFLLQFSIKLKQYLLRGKTRSDSFMGTCMLAKMLGCYKIFKEYYLFYIF